MRVIESIGAAIEMAGKRWPGAFLFVLFTAPLWLNQGLQLVKHWSSK